MRSLSVRNQNLFFGVPYRLLAIGLLNRRQLDERGLCRRAHLFSSNIRDDRADKHLIY